jgi:hypothetical protein
MTAAARVDKGRNEQNPFHPPLETAAGFLFPRLFSPTAGGNLQETP